MADTTKIEWTDATWNPITGCSVVSPGCTNCYAMRLAGTRMKHHHSRAGLTQESKAGPVWNGQVRLNEAWLDQPLRWKRPRMIFVCAHGDLFHENVPDDWIDRVFAVMALAPQHTFQVLTKRAKRMRVYFAGEPWDRINAVAGTLVHWEDMPEASIPLPNVWLGVSVEDQTRADERISALLATPAAVRFVSAEPLLGPVDLTRIVDANDLICRRVNTLNGFRETHKSLTDVGVDHMIGPRLDWLIVGGESGPGSRPMHPDWVRSLRDQCRGGVAFFFKQWGEWRPRIEAWEPRPFGIFQDGSYYQAGLLMGPINVEACEIARLHSGQIWTPIHRVGKRAAGRSLDGRTWDEMPFSEKEGRP